MNQILTWLAEYSPAVVILLAFGAALVFVLKNITEKAISKEFDRYKKEMELKLEKRSKFEEKILLDRYTLIGDIETRIGRVATDLHRQRQGIEVEGLKRGIDIVPLTEIFALLASNRYLITDNFYKILTDQSLLLTTIDNEKDPQKFSAYTASYLKLRDDFRFAMNEMFGIDKITWETQSS